jgi:hypothetical protein
VYDAAVTIDPMIFGRLFLIGGWRDNIPESPGFECGTSNLEFGIWIGNPVRVP